MRTLPVLLIGSLALGTLLTGCKGSDDDGTPVKPEVMLNPGGKPQNEEQAARATAQTQMGQSAKDEMAKNAKAAAEAQARSGGK